jgi:hypothetical protein
VLANDGGSPLIRTSEYIANSPRLMGYPRLMMDVAAHLHIPVGQDWKWMVPAERLGDWMGTGERCPVITWQRWAALHTGYGPASPARR